MGTPEIIAGVIAGLLAWFFIFENRENRRTRNAARRILLRGIPTREKR